MMIKKILVPLDGSAMAEGALDIAVEMAEGVKGSLALLRVVPPVAPSRFYAPHVLDELREAQVREAEAYLDEVNERRVQGLPAEAHILTGPAAQTVVDFANEDACDLITMSSHGLGGRGWQVFGSVTQKVLHSATQPVLIVKPGVAEWQREEEEEEARADAAMLNEMAQARARKPSGS